ncbi:hypothetical protein [Methylobacterium variabile]|jgi:hypothetical protein|nr:hypothetical protein [Methylobacterium variabile]
MNANDPKHRAGHDIDSADQVSSMVLLGVAAVGAALTVALNAALI